MKKYLVVVSLLLLILLSSCFDIYQHLSLHPKGQTNVYCQFLFSKVLMAVAQGFSSNPKEFDYNSWLNESDAKGVNSNFSIFNPKFEKIDNELDFGISVSFSIDLNDSKLKNKITTEKISFIPFKENNKIIILFNLGNKSFSNEINTESTYGEKMSYMFLSSARYRLSISKNVIKNISSVILEIGTEQKNIRASDLLDSFLIEVPLIFIIGRECKLIIQ